ncbi:uncharacterized protein B0I36DRAFT_330769 [Microdochium trichocladiopsis]|uniref:Nucleoporin Nup159/Nup146 N-terminal domain-containing protein n=1 Tax=Microdochium trichocladiopsis TaxID=1682393 RepID=A0A9P9BR31_9PEZI|nr:uncharacterized protein B0I36DRAFT_330769 [Microdochium trichocladiopsis]KAH7026502.1 hypothetical protein B0I36DRAFT_330769 [Microdochium trichocladiopsis]
MSFGFGSFGGASAASNTNGASAGPELETIQTEGLGFLAIAGSAKLRLVSQWSPAPAPTASLLSIASRAGLVAAASPDAVVIASTEDVRKAFEAPADGDSDVRPFQPQLSLKLPTRICQLAFTADENYLVLSAEQGGGLAAYEVRSLKQGSTQPSFQIPTNNEALRALVPNPQAATGELCAVVTSQGKLLVANMNDKKFAQGSNGQVLKEQVSCVAWSTKGKQLVAGLGDGTMVQMTPSGDVKAEIPRPSELDSSNYVSAVSWLENHVFLAFYVSTSEQPPTESCYLILRQGQNFTFQKFNDPIAPFGSEKAPHQTVTRLQDFPPNLTDVLILGSTATEETGLITRAKKSLASNAPAEKMDQIVDVFTTTELADDSRRATLPMGDGMDSPSPIGVALDLSSKHKVFKPIPADEIDESPGPLPGYWVLNDEGVLSIWWLVYNDSIREGAMYSGLVAADSNGNATSVTATTAPQQATSAAPAFGTSGFSAAKPATPAQASAFGSPAALGAKASPWGAQNSSSSGTTAGATFGSSTFGSATASSAPKFGAPSFGTAGGLGFGQAGSLGGKVSPWATATTASKTPAFGQSSFGAAPGAPATATSASPFSSAGGNAFSSFASKGGFSSIANNDSTPKANPFGSATTDNASSTAATQGSSAGGFGAKPATTLANPFGSLGSKPANSASSPNPFGAPFKLQSSFKPDPAAKDDDKEPDDSSETKKISMFDSGFKSTLGEASKTPAVNPFGKPPAGQSPFGQLPTVESTTPTSTPAPSKFLSPAPTPSGLFGQSTLGSGNTYGSLFGSQTPKAPVPGITVEAETPKATNTALNAPLPPESTKAPAAETAPLPPSFGNVPSKTSQAPPSLADTAPLPPDPVKNEKLYKVEIPPLPSSSSKNNAPDDAPLPPDPVRNAKAYNVVIPPLPDTKPAQKPVSDAPLPPDPVKQAQAYDYKFPPVPGTKSFQASTSILPQAPSTQNYVFKLDPNAPPVSDSEDNLSEEDDGEDEGTAPASEGSGVDVAKELSPESHGASKTPGYTPTSSFDGGLGGSFSNIARPQTLFGEVVPRLPKPNPVSPRSPSPVRSAVPPRIIGHDGHRSVSTPAMASQILGGARQHQQSRLGQSIVGKAAPMEDAIMEHQRKAKAKKEADENRLLVDEEDAAIQQLLASEIEPTLEVSEFIAHAGVAPPAADSIPAQVEAVYRDINSMIDTLGLNARSLSGFIQGQLDFGAEDRTKDDLSGPETWTLDEIPGLDYIIESDLGDALEHARVKDVENKLVRVAELKRELVRDFNKQADLKKAIAARIDPDQTVANRALPLSSEQAAQQNDLRREYARFTRVLAEAEEGLTLLKAKVVSANSASGKGGPTPTIEAVVRTITKMTSMVEKRSGDIDVLESQMRKMRLGSAGPASREGSPFALSTPKKSNLSSSLMFSPERSFRESTPVRGGSIVRHSLSGSISGAAGFKTPPRKKLSGFGDSEKKALAEKRERRSAVLGKLRVSIEKRGSQVIPMDHMA